MKKRFKVLILQLLILLVLLVPIFMLAGCSTTTSRAGEEFTVGNVTLVKIECGKGFDLFMDKDTHIIYIFNIQPSQGGLTPLINTDGLPMTYEQYIKLKEK